VEERTILVTRRLPGVPWDDLAKRFRAGDPPREGMGRLATENLLAVLDGREPPCPVN